MPSTPSKKTTQFSKMKMMATANLDPEMSKEMSKSLLKLTSSGNSSLDEKELKIFKRFCRKSDDYVRYSFLLIMEQLEKKHAEIRLSAFQVAAEIFERSHAFREILVTHLQEFLTLTTGTETNEPLPPPKAAANRLKEETLRTMQHWHDKFGKSYRKLDVGYNYLKNCKHVDFQNIQAQNEAERLRALEEEKRKKKQMADRLSKVLNDISENKTDIEDCIREAENCLSLLLPTPDDFLLFDAKDLQKSSVQKADTGDSSQEVKKNLASSNTTQGETGSDSRSISEDGNNSLKLNDKTDIKIWGKDVVRSTCSSDSDRRLKDSEKMEVDIPKYSNDIIPSKDEVRQGEDKDALEYSIEDSQKTTEVEENSSFEDEEEGSDYDDDESNRAHGLWNAGYSLNIDIPAEEISVKETEDNTDVLQSLRDVAKLINNSFLPQVVKWLEILGKNGGKDDSIKSMIDLKLSLETVRTKCQELNLVSSKDLTDNQDSDEDDLEDVPEKEGYEATVPNYIEEAIISKRVRKEDSQSAHLKRHQSAGMKDSKGNSDTPPLKKSKSCGPHWSLKDREAMESLDDPTSRAAALARIQASCGSSPSTLSSQPTTSREETKKAIPFVDFGKDLEFWGNTDKIEAPNIIKFDSLHRFWASGDKETEQASKNDISLMLNRTFNYTGQFKPVKWSCRAPLANGKLCPRMDRVKCPFHGPIIARDEDGNPAVKKEPTPSSSKTDTADGDESTPSTSHETHESISELPPWRDPELQREIEQATGHDLGSARSQKLIDKALNKGKGKGKGKRAKKSGLTDIKAALNTTRMRLEKRIFNKRSMKRVCANLDRADFKRVRDKFGNQFNYSLH